VEQNLLFYFLPELKSFGTSSDDNTTEEDGMCYLSLLIKHLEEAYELTSSQINLLLIHRRLHMTYYRYSLN
jgi:hypothetical protein